MRCNAYRVIRRPEYRNDLNAIEAWIAPDNWWTARVDGSAADGLMWEARWELAGGHSAVTRAAVEAASERFRTGRDPSFKKF